MTRKILWMLLSFLLVAALVLASCAKEVPGEQEEEEEEDDWRRNSQVVEMLLGFPIFEGEHFVHSLEIVERLKKIAASQGKSIAQLVAAWVLSNPAVTVALTGVRKPSEIGENVVAGDWKLTDEVKAERGAAFRG